MTTDSNSDNGDQVTPQDPDQTGGSSDSDNSGDQPTDYKALYQATLADSRKWERRAKSNKDASDELQQLKDAQKTESQKQADRLAELEAENAEFKAERDRATWASEVEDETGVPAKLLSGFSTREDMEAHAETLKPYLEASGGDSDDDGSDDDEQTHATRATSQAFDRQPAKPLSLRAQIEAAEKEGDHAKAASLKASMLGAQN